MKIYQKLFISAALLFAVNTGALSPHKDNILLTDSARAKLDSGIVIANVEKEIIEGQKLAFIQAAIKINAPREKVWQVFNDCARAADYVPGLISCEIVETAPDNSWEIRQHVAKHSALLPKMVSKFKSHYDYPKRIDFHIVGGNLKINEGYWQLIAADNDKATILLYEAHIASKSVLPAKIVRKAIKKSTPKTMRAIRNEVEQAQKY